MRIIALTPAGHRLGERIAASCDATLCYKPTPFTATIQAWFCQGEPLLFICATGIVVRTLAPVLTNKYADPPVLVMDEQGRFVIPLLSGHEGGANEWARQISQHSQAQLVLTTANPYLAPHYVVGMGCERHCTYEEVETLFLKTLAQVDCAVTQVAALSSLDIKADEVALCTLAQRYQVPFITWSASELCTMEPHLQTPSAYVKKTVGVAGVAEAAALYSCVQAHPSATPELVLPKQKSRRATCALARIYPEDSALLYSSKREPST